ncbi:MBL fold metallo-hydrolase [Luteibacter sp. SG786]|uniref:MBL fold metallo-hydrolase n=1 Tax=Luteibacter sp. SG786 TaxID=2587130 RepID=UPI001420EC01|nr:MBL fold metallo-hydrolase [Luteibacter sp. SG786]NII55615.1 ribonuclease BN (tRNA processing enzyme) [Luteibacter sp. SG786]
MSTLKAKTKTASLSLLCALVALGCGAARGQSAKSVWVELGTQAGPIPNPTRSEPAHVLLWRDQPILVDVGDGAAEQLAKAHIPIDSIHAVFISHLHFDHTGGLFAFLGMRDQGGGPGRKLITIYGPPGTKAMVDGLRSAMQSGSALLPQKPSDYKVVELSDGSSVSVGDVKVTTVSNSHYLLWRGSGAQPVSLSYRFDLPDRSIVYTGDTGPSANVEKLAHGADLLVSEIMDADTALDELKRDRPGISKVTYNFVRDHFTKEHLTPNQAGLLAAHAGVRALVLTHFGGATGYPDQIARLTKVIGENFHGSIRFATDLDQF